MYEADALQITTAKSLECDLFVSADTHLVEVARSEGLVAANVEKEPDRVAETLD